MKKVIFKLFSIIAVLLLMIQLESCKAISKDDAKTNLEGAGYKVLIMTGDEYEESDENTFAITSLALEYYLYAEKDADKIYIYFFYSIDDASNNEPFINHDGLSSGQNNNVIYYGTKQAIKDAKL